MVVALAAEAKALGCRDVRRGRLQHLKPESLVLLSGMGSAAAAQAAQTLVTSGAVALAVFGIAGGLSPQLHCGDLLLPDEIVDESGGRFAPDVAWTARLRRQLKAAGGILLTAETPLLDAATKADARRRWNAVAVDMESAAVARVARDHGLPFLALRAIADEALDALPAGLTQAVDEVGRPRPVPLMAALLSQPGLILRLPQLALMMDKAEKALRDAVGVLGPSLAFAG